MNLGFQDTGSKVEKIIAVLECKMHEAYGEGWALPQHQVGEDIKTHIKCLLLMHQIENQMLNNIFDQVKADPNFKHLMCTSAI